MLSKLGGKRTEKKNRIVGLEPTLLVPETKVLTIRL